MSAATMTGYEWPDLVAGRRRAEADLARLRNGVETICVDAERRKGPHRGLVGAKRLRSLLAEIGGAR